MILHRQARFNPNSNLDPIIGNAGIFRESDFYCKSKQADKLPETHEFDERLVTAYEFLYQLLELKFGTKAKPWISSSLRIEGDPNYRTSSGNLSYHSRAKAADANWNQHSQDIEDFIVCVVGYDIEKEGKIYERLQAIGINGFGTYYREREGTFLHLDTRDHFIHFRKIRRYKLPEAKKWHKEFMELAYKDATINALLNGGEAIPNPERDYAAMDSGKSIILFKSVDCASCASMVSTFYDWQEANAQKDNNWWTIDVSHQTPSEQEAQERYQVAEFPTILFLQDGIEIKRITGSTDIEDLQGALEQLDSTDPDSWTFIAIKAKEAVVSTTKEIKNAVATPTGAAQDAIQEVINIAASSEEDPFKTEYTVFQWIVRVVIIIILLFGLYYFIGKASLNG